MKIDRLIEKTTEKDEAKKWKVVVGIVVGISICFLMYFGLLLISEPIIDDYLSNVSPHPKATLYAYSIYDNTSANYSNSVFFMGSSIVGNAFKTDKISSVLAERGFSDITVYNLHMPMDTPLMRSMEIQKIIDSNPSMVIFGITYRDVMDVTWSDDRTTLVYDSLKIRDDSLHLYNSYELNDIQTPPNFDHKKLYLLSALRTYFGDNVVQSAPLKTIDELKEQANTSDYLVWHPEIGTENTRYKDALVYNVRTLKDAGIDVVIINMPISPILSDLISNESRQNYFNILNNTTAVWYDFEKDYDYDFFKDLMHATDYGSTLFAPVVADIIIQEMS